MMRTAISPRFAIKIRGLPTRSAPAADNRVRPNGSQTSDAVRTRPGACARTRGAEGPRAVRRGYRVHPGDGPVDGRRGRTGGDARGGRGPDGRGGPGAA